MVNTRIEDMRWVPDPWAHTTRTHHVRIPNSERSVSQEQTSGSSSSTSTTSEQYTEHEQIITNYNNGLIMITHFLPQEKYDELLDRIKGDFARKEMETELQSGKGKETDQTGVKVKMGEDIGSNPSLTSTFGPPDSINSSTSSSQPKPNPKPEPKPEPKPYAKSFSKSSPNANPNANPNPNQPKPKPKPKPKPRRMAIHYGPKYDYTTNHASPNPTPVPEYIQNLINLITPYLGGEGLEMNQATLQFYPPGAGIPPHIDTHSCFSTHILSFSLGSSVHMGFQKADEVIRGKMFAPRRCATVISPDSATDSATATATATSANSKIAIETSPANAMGNSIEATPSEIPSESADSGIEREGKAQDPANQDEQPIERTSKTILSSEDNIHLTSTAYTTTSSNANAIATVDTYHEIPLPPNSLCIMTNEIRYAWTHGIRSRATDPPCARQAEFSHAKTDPHSHPQYADTASASESASASASASVSDLDLAPIKRGDRYSITFRKVDFNGVCKCDYGVWCDSQQNPEDRK